jgi:hypothetical protein
MIQPEPRHIYSFLLEPRAHFHCHIYICPFSLAHKSSWQLNTPGEFITGVAFKYGSAIPTK